MKQDRHPHLFEDEVTLEVVAWRGQRLRPAPPATTIMSGRKMPWRWRNLLMAKRMR